jgi:hypothetical protein
MCDGISAGRGGGGRRQRGGSITFEHAEEIHEEGAESPYSRHGELYDNITMIIIIIILCFLVYLVPSVLRILRLPTPLL